MGMSKDNYPTFRKLIATMQRHRRALVGLILTSGIVFVALKELESRFAAPPVCDQPCPDAVACEPLQFNFDIFSTRIKTGDPYALWYKAEIVNRTCRRLGGLSVKGFINPDEIQDFELGLWITVEDAHGKKLARYRRRVDGGISWDHYGAKGVDISSTGTIYPYQFDRREYRRLMDSGKIDDMWFTDLRPKESMRTLPAVADPYRLVATSAFSDSGITDGFSRVRANDAPQVSSPPKDHAAMDFYRFLRPGRYVIRAGYKGSCRPFQEFPHWEGLPRWAKSLFRRLRPSEPFPDAIEVNLKARPVEIEVVP